MYFATFDIPITFDVIVQSNMPFWPSEKDNANIINNTLSKALGAGRSI